MKKNYFFLAMAGLVVVLFAALITPVKSPGNRSTALMTTNVIPENLQMVFKSSCMPCHATDGSGMAMAKLNFSEWDTYDSVKQIKKAEAICNEISEDAMPPKSFKKSHPEAIPTIAQKDSICVWSRTLVQN